MTPTNTTTTPGSSDTGIFTNTDGSLKPSDKQRHYSRRKSFTMTKSLKKSIGKAEQMPKLEGKRMIMMLAPAKKK